jgi:glycosyltransferase involved in cell wall biosynthesis
MKEQNPVILFPTPSFFPAQTGGPDNTCYWLTKALTSAGVKTIISSTDFGLPTQIKRGEWLNTDYGRIKYTHNLVHYMPIKTIWYGFLQMSKVNLIHLTMITYPASWLTALINHFTYRKQIVWSSRGDLDAYMLKRSPRKKKFVLWLINNVLGKEKIWFHATCEAEVGYIRDQFGDVKIVQITNYMDIPQRVVQPKEKEILFLGRIDKKKGIENLVEAVSQSEIFLNSDFRIVIGGDEKHPYGQELINLVASQNLQHKIIFVGHVSGIEKEKLLARAHFLIMPSHTENFGIVVTEALAQGTPAIASTGTPWKALADHQAGFWIDNDPESIKRILERVLSMSPAEYASYQENALRLVKEEFSMDANIGKWIAFYNFLSMEGKPAPEGLIAQ